MRHLCINDAFSIENASFVHKWRIFCVYICIATLSYVCHDAFKHRPANCARCIHRYPYCDVNIYVLIYYSLISMHIHMPLLSAPLCVCIYMYPSICFRIYIHIHIFLYGAPLYVSMYIYVFIYICPYMVLPYMYAYMYMVHPYMYTYMYMVLPYMYPSLYMVLPYMYAYIYMPSTDP